MSSCRVSLLCCVTWLCYYVIGVNYRKTIRPPPLLSSLIARDGNHCSWSNRCPFSQSTSWVINIKYFFSTFSFLCDIKLSHSTLASQRLVPPIQFWCPSQVATVTWRHAVSRNVTQRSIRERERHDNTFLAQRPALFQFYREAGNTNDEERMLHCVTLWRSHNISLMTHYIGRPGENEGNSGNVLHFLPIELMRPNLCIWPFCKFCIIGGCQGESDIFI